MASRLMVRPCGLWPRSKGSGSPSASRARLSFRTVFSPDPSKRPYNDDPGADGFLRYKWRGDDPEQADNRALRSAMVAGLPLIWFHGVASGIYLPVFPSSWQQRSLRRNSSSCRWMRSPSEQGRTLRWKTRGSSGPMPSEWL